MRPWGEKRRVTKIKKGNEERRQNKGTDKIHCAAACAVSSFHIHDRFRH